MNDYTRGTLRVRTKDEYPNLTPDQITHLYDYTSKEFDRIEREVETIGKLSAVALVILFGVGLFLWGTL